VQQLLISLKKPSGTDSDTERLISLIPSRLGPYRLQADPYLTVEYTSTMLLGKVPY